ncbi:putative trehalose-phosphate phosphatase D [Zea mays]|uniref:Putative trehalose-phosphate phosphatase D n=1 Tax=Zea mays TaxID=4577 RepID=A0A1D6QEE2_MAIZE|nr:putative trehalose-phosphate phosphatase D [Zea mays]
MGSHANGSTCAGDGPPPMEKRKEPAFPLKTMPLHANGWLNNMKLSSPTAVPVNIGNSVAFDPIYRAWTQKYPSALNAFERIAACGKGKKIVMFLVPPKKKMAQEF